MIGVITDSVRDDIRPNFFVPLEKLACAAIRGGEPFRANSMYLGTLEDLAKLGVGSWDVRSYILLLRSKYAGIAFLIETTCLDEPTLREYLALFDSVVDLQVSIVVIVPAVEDVAYWAMLRDYRGNLRFCLCLDNSLSLKFVARYKTLVYDAILVRSIDSAEIAAQLAAKRGHPDILIQKDEGVGNLQSSIRKCVASSPISPYSDMLIDPLQPLTVQMSLEVYETFEKDQVKYSQYDLAIEMAIDDLRYRSTTLTILVVGPGRGPLLQSVLKYRGPNDRVVAVEKNIKCMDLLAQVVDGHTNVDLIHGDVRNLESANYNLVISELLGSFGCNEACPEILQHLTSSSLIFIPLEYTSYVQPIYTDLLTEKITRPYLALLNSYFPVGDIVEVFHHDHSAIHLNQKMAFSIHANNSDLEINLDSNVVLDYANALHGFFDANLYGPYRISLLPQTNSHERCLSWFPMVFPLGEAKVGESVTITRISDGSKMWYEWTVGDTQYNVGGEYSVDLQ